MYRIIFFLLCGSFLLGFSFLSSAHAATMTLQNGQSSLGIGDEYVVDATLSVSSPNGTKYFLRGVFYQDGTNNYCGYTYNGLDWYNGPYTTNNGWEHLLPIVVNNSSWSGQLKAKLDINDSGCSSSGTYNFKVQRYTNTSANTNTGTFDTQNEQTLTVVVPTPTPTPLPPTSTPKPLPTNTPAPTQKPTATTHPTQFTPTEDITFIDSSASSSLSGVLGASISSMPTLVAGIADKKETATNMWAIVFILGGVLLLSSCGILVFILRKKGMLWYGKNNEEL